MANLLLQNYSKAKPDLVRAVRSLPNDIKVRSAYQECERRIREQLFSEAIQSAETTVWTLENISNYPADNAAGPVPENGLIDANYVQQIIEYFKCDKLIHQKFALQIILSAQKIFESQPSLVNISVPEGVRLTVVGDVHGQFFDVMKIFELYGMPNENSQWYLFNGDFVDRGAYSTEVALTLFALKVSFPNSFFISRGNHEFDHLNRVYGFEMEVKKKYSPTLYSYFQKSFRSLPLCHTINNSIFVVHGGIPGNCPTVQEIQSLDRFSYNEDAASSDSLITPLMWSDPREQDGIGRSFRGPNVQEFGPDITQSFLTKNSLKLIIRSHVYKTTGFEIEHKGSLITVFSAPNYHDSEESVGAVIHVDSASAIDIQTFSAAEYQGKLKKANMAARYL